jgi:hypothetical protein
MSCFCHRPIYLCVFLCLVLHMFVHILVAIVLTSTRVRDVSDCWNGPVNWMVLPDSALSIQSMIVS